MRVDIWIWVDHFRNDNRHLAEWLMAGAVLCHTPIIVGLALCTLNSRGELLTLLDVLPEASGATGAKAGILIHFRRLSGTAFLWSTSTCSHPACFRRYILLDIGQTPEQSGK